MALGKRRGSDSASNEEINISPLIDVVFILLIFFMLASNFNKIGELKMDVTKESSQASNQDIKLFKLKVS